MLINQSGNFSVAPNISTTKQNASAIQAPTVAGGRNPNSTTVIPPSTHTAGR